MALGACAGTEVEVSAEIPERLLQVVVRIPDGRAHVRASSAMAERRRTSARLSLDFTVPTGQPMTSAVSASLNSAK